MAVRSSTPRRGNSDRSGCTSLEQLPNVGPAVAAFLRRLGLSSPENLKGRDPYTMFDDLCRITGHRHDPCLLDTFIAVTRFMNGEPAEPWWKYTAERKKRRAAREKGGDHLDSR